MSVVSFVAALSAMTSVALGSPPADSADAGAVQTFQAESHARLHGTLARAVFKEERASHSLDVTPESHPVRFHTDVVAGLKMESVNYAAAKPVKSQALTTTKKPKSGIRTYGAITNLSENVQAIVDYYDEMEWRPIEMDGGAGVEYRMKFGAPEGK